MTGRFRLPLVDAAHAGLAVGAARGARTRKERSVRASATVRRARVQAAFRDILRKRERDIITIVTHFEYKYNVQISDGPEK